MSETKILTLDEAKADIQGYKTSSERELAGLPNPPTTIAAECSRQWTKGYQEGLGAALRILARVEQPSEEDMAVLWLMKEFGWATRRTPKGWQLDKWMDGDHLWHRFDPVAVAKELGWKP